MKRFFAFVLLFLGAAHTAGYTQTDYDIVQFYAEIKNQSVYLHWNTTGNVPKLILYRSLNPFTDFSSLANAVLLSTFSKNTKAFIDYPLPNTNYYYALVFENDVTSGTPIKFIPSKNSILVPIRIEAATEETELVERALSLPTLNTSEAVQTKRATFSAETEQKLRELETKFGKYPAYARKAENPDAEKLPAFFRFTEETAAGRDVTALSLKRILDTYSETKSWLELEAELTKFLQLSHSDFIDARAAFYRAEACFFAQKYDSALLQFLQVEDTFKLEAKKWIALTLEKLTEK